MIFFLLNAPQHLVVSSHEPLFLILAVVVFGRHVGGDSHHTAFFNPVKAEIERGFIAPVDDRNDPEPFGCPVSAAPTIMKYIVKLHDRCHFQVHAEIRRQHCTVPGQFFNVIVWVLPDPLKAIVIWEEVYHAVEVILVLQMGLVKANQQKIIEAFGTFLELRNDGDF